MACGRWSWRGRRSWRGWVSNYSNYCEWQAVRNSVIRDNWGKLSPREIREAIITRRSEMPTNPIYPYPVPTVRDIIFRARFRMKIIDDEEYQKWCRHYERKPLTPTQRQAIRMRDGNRCILCSSKESLEVDHIVPVCLGGTNDSDNLQTLCKKCNRKKGGNVANFNTPGIATSLLR